jgi:flagellar hook-length control protein FliK
MTPFSIIPGLAVGTPANAGGDDAAAGTDGAFADLLGPDGIGGGGFGSPQGDPLAAAVSATFADDGEAATDLLAVLAWLPWMQQQAGDSAANDAGPDHGAPQAAPSPLQALAAGDDAATPLRLAPVAIGSEDGEPETATLPAALAGSRRPAPPVTPDNALSPPQTDPQPLRSAAIAPAVATMAVEPKLRAEPPAAEPSGPEPRIDMRLSESSPAPRTESPRPAFELNLPGQTGARFTGTLQDGIESRLQWMAERGIGRAQIRLSPAELGNIEIRLETDGKQVRAEFVSSNADVRQALESQLPRLREMFLAQGMTLTHADVGQGRDSAGSGAGERDGSAHAQADGSDRADGSEQPAAQQATLRQQVGLLDEYA